MRISKLIILLPLLFLSLSAWGQFDPTQLRNGGGMLPNGPANRLGNRQGPGNSNMPNGISDTASADTTNNPIKGIEYHEDIPDSILQQSIYIFHRQPMTVKIMDITHPLITPTGAQFHNPLDAFNGQYYLSVTELGHPHYSIFPSFGSTPGLKYKSTLYPGFYKTPQNINFYQVKNPYEVLSYHSSLTKSYQVQLTHTQNINNHWNYSLDYHLYGPKGAFSNSAATDHVLDITTNYYSPDARYQVYAGFIWQKMVIGENQGLSNPSAFINKRTTSIFGIPVVTSTNTSGIPVVSSRGSSQANDLTLFVHQSFNTVRQFEWYRPIHQTFVDTNYQSDTIHLPYFDTTKLDTLYRDSITVTPLISLHDSIIDYDTFQPHAPHCYNTGVFSLDLQYDRQRYRYSDSSTFHLLSAELFWTNDAYMDHRWHNPVKLYGGIRPQYASLQLNEAYYTSATVHRAALYPFGRLIISPWPASELTVNAECLPNLSEYNLDANLRFPFRDSLGHSRQHISISATTKAYQPELIYFAQTIHSAATASQPLSSIGVQQLKAEYTRPSLFGIMISATRVSHNVWFDYSEAASNQQMLVTVQSPSSFLLLQARANLYLSLASWLHIDMQQHLQYSSDQAQQPAPLFASKNSLYSDFYLFNRALRTQVGLDLRYHTRFYAPAYDPYLGIFYHQQQEQVGNYLTADFFVNLQIKRASIYFKVGHFNSLIESTGYCEIPNYPTQQFGIFYGLTWKFFD